MELGFETIGNATVICHDRRPVLATDPWINGSPYFGSWSHSHTIPEEQASAIDAAEYVWISHGHPDHLSPESLRSLRARKILVPDHRGSRIRDDLRQLGYEVEVLPSRVWHQLSDRIRVLSIADYNQDAILLIDIGGHLVVNVNDAGDHGWGGFVASTAKGFRNVFLLKLVSHGDADMINLHDPEGRRTPPIAAPDSYVSTAARRESARYGARFFIPFSSMHRYQRADSIWANRYTTKLDRYEIGSKVEGVEILPAFVRYDCVREHVEQISPPEFPASVHAPEEYGDNWSDCLDPKDVEDLEGYFRPIEHLGKHFDHLTFRVGGKNHVIDFGSSAGGMGIQFEVPRGSLMQAIEYRVFDDLMIGNFMKVTLQGERARLYPNFTPYVAKYADNGGARSDEELEAYFADYRRRAPLEYFRHIIELTGRRIATSVLDPESEIYARLSTSYHRIRSVVAFGMKRARMKS